MTTTASPAISLKGSRAIPSSSSAATTLRSLYPRAARAFLQRDVALTFSLLSSAFSLIAPPDSVTTTNDALASHRRKWEILRLTFETTLYASPPSTQDPDSLPSALRANLMLSPEPLIATLHTRSLQLFTPSEPPQKATSAFLPAQILVTLVLASLKLDCVEVGRGMVEDWLAKRGQESDADDPKGYAKVLELYCLHVLPRLQDWEYAEGFLTYEGELPQDIRQQFVLSLRQLRAESATAANSQIELPTVPSPSTSGSSTPSRTPSPAMSDSSSSTHTATPRTPHPVRGLTPLTPSQTPTPQPREKPPHSASSSSIASTATSRTVTPHTAERAQSKTRAANGHARPGAQRPATRASRSSTPTSSASVVPRAAASSFGPASEAASAARAPSTLALVRASAARLLQGMSRSQVLLYAVLCVVVPLVSFVVRVRRRQARAGAEKGPAGVGAGSGAVAAVRRRLRSADGRGSVVGKVWAELARAVLDTVSMAGRGLV